MMRIVIGIIVVSALGVMLYFAFGGYGELGPRGGELTLALRGAIGRQDTLAVEETLAATVKALKEGSISEQEASWLRAIIDDAQQGDWTSAAKAATKLMGEQVTENPLPEL